MKFLFNFFLGRKLSAIKRKIDLNYLKAVDFQRNGKLREYAQTLDEIKVLEELYEKHKKEQK